MLDQAWEFSLSSGIFKFNSAHINAYKGCRGTLHGHNYRVYVTLKGIPGTGPDSFLESAEFKNSIKHVCKIHDHCLLVAERSEAFTYEKKDGFLHAVCSEDGAKFMFPLLECMLLPIKSTSNEELASYLWWELIKTIGLETIHNLNVRRMDISVMSSPKIGGTFSANIPGTLAEAEEIVNI